MFLVQRSRLTKSRDFAPGPAIFSLVFRIGKSTRVAVSGIDSQSTTKAATQSLRLGGLRQLFYREPKR